MVLDKCEGGTAIFQNLYHQMHDTAVDCLEYAKDESRSELRKVAATVCNRWVEDFDYSERHQPDYLPAMVTLAKSALKDRDLDQTWQFTKEVMGKISDTENQDPAIATGVGTVLAGLLTRTTQNARDNIGENPMGDLAGATMDTAKYVATLALPETQKKGLVRMINSALSLAIEKKEADAPFVYKTAREFLGDDIPAFDTFQQRKL